MKPTTILTIINFLLFMSRGMVLPLSSVFWRELGASYLVIGALSTVRSLTAIVASPLWGRALDRYKQRKGFLLGGLLLMAASTGLIVFIPGYTLLFPLYIATSIGQAAVATASLALMGDWLEYEGQQNQKSEGTGRTSGRRMGTYRGLGSLGFGLMAFSAGMVVDRLSLRAPFGLSALFLLIAALLVVSVKEAPGDASAEEAGAAGLTISDAAAESASAGADNASAGAGNTSTQPADNLPLTPLMVAALLWSLVTGAVYAVWANYMVEEIGYTPAQTTRIWSLASLSEFPLMIVAGWLSDRLGRLPMLATGFVAWTMVFTGYLLVPGMPWIIVVQLIRGFAYSAYEATAMIYAAEVRKRAERGRISGLYQTAGSVGSIAGSSLGGAVTEYAGFQTLIGLCAGLIFSGALYLGGAAIKHRSRGQVQHT
jgi:MFS family permease